MSADDRPALRVALGSDDVGRALKDEIEAHLAGSPSRPARLVEPAGIGDEDLDAPEVARSVAETIRRGEADRGILVCGSGVGMVVTANKVPGVRAAQAHDVYTAAHARHSDDVQVLVLGSRVIGVELAKVVVDAFLAADFEPNDTRRRRMAKLAAIEGAYLRPAGDAC